MNFLANFLYTKPFRIGWLGIFALLPAFFSCRTEEKILVVNEAPYTVMSVDTIQLNGESRLITQVKLHWSATDADGYVTGYRVSWGIDSLQAFQKLASALVVKRTDSTFQFNFNSGSDTSDVYFFVESIDDKNLVDPSPASLRIPVKNSPPVIQFLDDGLSSADTLWTVLSFPYAFSDPDGLGNIDSVFIKVNEGAWVGLPRVLTFVSLVPVDPTISGMGSAYVYGGENQATLNKEPVPLNGIMVPGFQVNGINTVYLKIRDLAGAIDMDTAKPYFVRQKTSDLLLIDAYKGEGGFIGDSLYTNLISEFTNYDRIDLIVNGGVNQPKFWNSTFYLTAKLYKKIFWYSDIYTTTPGLTPLLLTYAAASFNQYLRFNGKLLVSATFPDGGNQLSLDDPVFSLLPIDSITKQSNNVRLRRGLPLWPRQPGYDTLRSTNFLITGVDLFYPRAGVDTLHVIPKTSVTSLYTGPALPIALRAKNPFTSKTNLVFFGMEMLYLSGNRPALKNTFTKILNEEFNW